MKKGEHIFNEKARLKHLIVINIFLCNCIHNLTLHHG